MTELAKLAREALRQVIDPEAGLNIVDFGLIYDIAASDDEVTVVMTLTSETCPLGPQIMIAVEEAIAALPGNPMPNVLLTFEPEWTPDRISAEGRQKLGGDRFG